MSDVLSSITGGIARFALAWLLPTSIAVGLFWGVCVPSLVDQDLLPNLTGANGKRGAGEALAIAAFIGFSISIVLAYSSQLIYRILEGYHLPASVEQWMSARQRTRRERLSAIVQILGRHPTASRSRDYGLAVEQLELYPRDANVLMPTRLGNALRSLESYGQRVYSLDSQQFWFELIGTADDTVRREHEETRAMVDLFVSAVAVFAGLAVAAAAVGIFDAGAPGPIALAGFSAALVPIAYRGALRNMKDWQNSVRAMVNLGRYKVADGIGLQVPWLLDDERRMWGSVSRVLHYDADPDSRAWLDVFRRGTPHKVERGEIFGSTLAEEAAQLEETEAARSKGYR